MKAIHGGKTKTDKIDSEKIARVHDPDSFHRLKTVPGIGKILAMVLMYEIQDINRFASVGDFLSYARPVRGSHESAGKSKGSPNKQIGNAHLKWAFSEAITLFMRECEQAKRFVERKAKKHSKPKPMSVLAAKLLGKKEIHVEPISILPGAGARARRITESGMGRAARETFRRRTLRRRRDGSRTRSPYRQAAPNSDRWIGRAAASRL
jgi:hypothetical protein